MIQLYTDENVEGGILDGLAHRGVNVETARQAGITGTVDDERHLQHAVATGRVLVSGDMNLLATSTHVPFHSPRVLSSHAMPPARPRPLSGRSAPWLRRPASRFAA